MKKHQAVLAEINNHEHRITAVSKSAQQMLHDGHFASDEIKLRAGNLSDHWTQLKEKALQVKSSPTQNLLISVSFEYIHQYNRLPSKCLLYVRKR